jgi:hypothetical protein
MEFITTCKGSGSLFVDFLDQKKCLDRISRKRDVCRSKSAEGVK